MPEGSMQSQLTYYTKAAYFGHVAQLVKACLKEDYMNTLGEPYKGPTPIECRHSIMNTYSVHCRTISLQRKLPL